MEKGWGNSSEAPHLPDMHEAMKLIPSTTKPLLNTQNPTAAQPL